MDEDATDTQFNRAVDIVQSLPKSGPIQTSYEEKLSLYALYKQATEGDIRIPRPGLLDMLGRAKWDTWNRQKGLDKTEAKSRYVAALLKILKKHADPNTKNYILEIESFAGAPVRASSPSSSTSSYHSSQASPPLSPPSPASPPSYVLYPPPDPTMPIPDVAPDIVPPSALNSSHRSLLNLLQSPAPQSEHPSMTGHASQAGPGAYIPTPASRAHSLRGSERGIGPSLTPLRSGSGSNRPMTSSAAAAFGLSQVPGVYGTSSPQPNLPSQHHTQHIPNTSYSPQIAGPSTPIPTPYDRPHQQMHPTPTHLQRPGSTSTFAQGPPINIPSTLQSIQLSLTALHERLSTLERSQAMLLRREDRRSSLSWPLSWIISDHDDLDEMEDEADRSRWRNIATTSRTGNVATSIRRRRALPFRVVWGLMSAIRRAMLDISVGLIVLIIASVLFGGGWIRARRTLARLMIQARRFIAEL